MFRSIAGGSNLRGIKNAARAAVDPAQKLLVGCVGQLWLPSDRCCPECRSQTTRRGTATQRALSWGKADKEPGLVLDLRLKLSVSTWVSQSVSKNPAKMNLFTPTLPGQAHSCCRSATSAKRSHSLLLVYL
jgi:hypothetical protein